MAPSVAEIKQDASEAIDQIQQVKQSVKTVDLLAASKAVAADEKVCLQLAI